VPGIGVVDNSKKPKDRSQINPLKAEKLLLSGSLDHTLLDLMLEQIGGIPR